eukprot:4615599-Prymnesium_polylepis.2
MATHGEAVRDEKSSWWWCNCRCRAATGVSDEGERGDGRGDADGSQVRGPLPSHVRNRIAGRLTYKSPTRFQQRSRSFKPPQCHAVSHTGTPALRRTHDHSNRGTKCTTGRATRRRTVHR